MSDDPWAALRQGADAPEPGGAPGQRLLSPRRPTRSSAPARPSRRRSTRLGRPALLGTAGVALVIVLAAAGASWSRGATSPVDDVGAVPPTADAPADGTTTSTTEPCPVSAASLAADVDGDGCPEDLRVEFGVLITPIGRYAVGEVGDVVLVGDWDCDGIATPAAFRPTTGSVFLFPTWANDGELTQEPTATIEGGESAEAVDTDGDGCAEVIVHRAEGDPEIVRPP